MREILTPEEVAIRLKMSPITIRGWLRAGHMKGIKLGKEWRVREEDLEAFVNASAESGWGVGSSPTLHFRVTTHEKDGNSPRAALSRADGSPAEFTSEDGALAFALQHADATEIWATAGSSPARRVRVVNGVWTEDGEFPALNEGAPLQTGQGTAPT